MMKIAIRRKDGGVSIMGLAGVAAEAARLAPEHLDTIVNTEIGHWHQSQQDEVVDWYVIEDSDLPVDNTFRNAWEYDGTKINTRMDKAREIHRHMLRKMRAPKLSELDVAYQRADEVGDTDRKKKIVALKQRLRDMPADPRIEAASTPEELKAVIPEALSEKLDP